MADVITRMRVDSSEYDNKIKRAQQNLLSFEQQCRATKQSMNTLSKENLEYVKSIGNMSTVSTNTRGKINELTNAFTELSMQYKRLTDEEKKGDFGKALTSSLDQLKVRITDTKAQLSDVAANLGDVGSGGVNLQSVLDQLGGKLGINTSLLNGLSSGTIGATAAIGALVTTTLAAAKAFADYNSELSMQGQVTTVTTGLKGPEADRMTDAARSLADIYGTDFREVINAANTLMTQFGQTGEQSIQLIRDGMQGMIMGDGSKLLSMIQQYAPSFRDAGISASQLVAIIHNSEGGIFTDQNMNAIVMGIKNIRLMTKQTSEALGKMGIDGEEMSKKLSDGSMSVFEALQQVVGKLKNTESGSKAAGEVMQYVFGRQGATAGTNLAKAIETLNTDISETRNQTGELGKAFADLERANEDLNKAIREAFGYDGWQTMTTGIKTKLIGALTDVIEKTGDIRDMLGEVGITGEDIFNSVKNAATNSLGPLGKVLKTLTTISQLNAGSAADKVVAGDIDAAANAGANSLMNVVNRHNIIKPALDLDLDPDPDNNKSAKVSVKVPGITEDSPILLNATSSALQDLLNRYARLMDEARTAKGTNTVEGLDTYISKSREAHGMENQIVATIAPVISDADITDFQDQINTAIQGMEIEPVTIKMVAPGAKELAKDGDNVTTAWQGATSVIRSVGTALSSIENPAGKVAMIIAEAVANIAGGFAAAIGKDGAKSKNIWAFIASTAAAITEMGVAISAVKSQTKYAEGGIVKGNYYSGDNIMANGGTIGINAGELILNRAQQGNLASQLSENRNPYGMSSRPYVNGEQIYLGLNNYLRRTGRGEIVTTY